MSERFQVLAADKSEGVTQEEAQQDLELRFPDYKVEVFDRGTQFIAKLERIAADDEEEPKAKKDIPPFLEEGDDTPEDAPEGEDEGEESNEPPKPPTNKKKDKADKEDVDGPPGDGEDAPDADADDDGGDDLSKALKALDTLKSVLPKLEKQLKGGLGDVSDDLPVPGGPGGDVPPPPHGPGGPGPHDIGPTPGAPPSAAGGPPGGPSPFPGVPNVNHGLDKRKAPPVGVPTFGNVRPERFVFRPALNPDGTRSSFEQALAEIGQVPKYAGYEVKEMKYDDSSDQWVAHLKLREG